LFLKKGPLGETVESITGKGTAILAQASTGPVVSTRMRLPDFMTISAHEGGKVVGPVHHLN